MTRFLTILTLVIALASCSSEPAQTLTSDVTKATNQGRTDAETLIASDFATEREFHSALLSVKSREWKLRQQGDSLGAEAYIRAFRDYLFENDAELAAKVF